MRRVTLFAVALLVLFPSPALAGQSQADRVQDLRDEIDSLTEEIEDLQEPIEEFELFDQCAYLIGVSERAGYLFGSAGAPRRRALSLDIRGFGRPQFSFLAFPAEEPPSIECNEDAHEEDNDD
jgi:hypothetical protein